jgi:tetratricopeptide (TPR) repeat protein
VGELLAARRTALAERLEPELFTAGRGPAMDRLMREEANIRAALTWALQPPGYGQDESERLDLALRLVGALWVWYRREAPAEGRRFAEAALARVPERLASRPFARAMFVAGQLAWAQGDVVAARTWLGRAADRWRTYDDPPGLALVLSYLALAVAPEEGRSLAEESLALARLTGDVRGKAWAWCVLGSIHDRLGNGEPAVTALRRSAATYRALGDAWLAAVPLAALGGIAPRAGRYEEANAALAASLSGFEESGDRLYAARAPGPGCDRRHAQSRARGSEAAGRGDYRFRRMRPLRRMWRRLDGARRAVRA